MYNRLNRENFKEANAYLHVHSMFVWTFRQQMSFPACCISTCSLETSDFQNREIVNNLDGQLELDYYTSLETQMYYCYTHVHLMSLSTTT